MPFLTRSARHRQIRGSKTARCSLTKTQKLVQLGYKSLVAWLHQYMAFAALMLMYSLGLALWNTLTLGLEMPCTDVTMLQLLHTHTNQRNQTHNPAAHTHTG